jgi:kynureninase
MGNPFASLGLAGHYTRFRVGHRLLLTGHSHQAWPDVAFDAQQRAWLDAAALVDDKWQRAEAIAVEVRAGWRRLLNDPNGVIALGQNTHELLVRLLSGVLPLFQTADAKGQRRRKLITTNGEFHTIRRQLDRLAEEGISVIKIDARPSDTLSERLAASVDDETACVMVSSVLFETAEIVPGLASVAAACHRHGATLLVDAYHHLNVVPFDIESMGLSNAFVVGGGYKYCQLGEGNAFLRVPPGCDLRPVLTGWFSEFVQLAETRRPGEVPYGEGAARFAGATYDPTSHYRAAAVFLFHHRMGMTAERLREASRHQVAMLISRIEAFDLNPAVADIIAIPAERRGGFLAIRCAQALPAVFNLRARNVFADARGDVLRLGPAPYLSDQQLREAGDIIGDVLKRLK